MKLARILKTSTLSIGSAGVLILGSASAARAISFITNPTTGNEYGLTDNIYTWTDAQAIAQSLSGNLVTINNAAEQQWLTDTFGLDTKYWIGLTDQTEEGNFQWISSEMATYRNWALREPNNFDPGENYTVMNWNIPGEESGKWNDLSALRKEVGIVERRAAVAVPTPAPLTSLIGLGIGVARKKRKQTATQ